jgi:hypothetical protein
LWDSSTGKAVVIEEQRGKQQMQTAAKDCGMHLSQKFMENSQKCVYQLSSHRTCISYFLQNKHKLPYVLEI